MKIDDGGLKDIPQENHDKECVEDLFRRLGIDENDTQTLVDPTYDQVKAACTSILLESYSLKK